ncbi:MAG: YqhA family protein [Cyanobacteria bacterium]|nr:YqhA family protein [Cyanobacteriota bacterium]
MGRGSPFGADRARGLQRGQERSARGHSCAFDDSLPGQVLAHALRSCREVFDFRWVISLNCITLVGPSASNCCSRNCSGTKSIFRSLMALQSLEAIGDQGHSFEAELLAGIVSGIDLYLIGIALLIFGYGIYELLISSIDAAREANGGASNGLLDIRDLDQLKEKLVKVLVVALIVTAFKYMLTLKVDDGQSLLLFCTSVLVLALSGYLISGNRHHKDHS